MVRPNGSSAPATAQQRGFQLPLLLKLVCNQPCGHKQVDMPCLLLGQSRPDGQPVKVFSALLVRIVRDDTSQLVVAPAQCVVSMLVSGDDQVIRKDPASQAGAPLIWVSAVDSTLRKSFLPRPIPSPK